MPLWQWIREKRGSSGTAGIRLRSIEVFHPDRSEGTCNRIRTNKYQWYSFIPKNAWEQLSQAANLYFLILAVLQCFPSVSNSGGYPVIVLPLSLVLGIGAIKDFIEDLQCARSDRRINMQETLTLQRCSLGVSEELCVWHELLPGMVVVLRDGDQVPADAVVIGTSDLKGCCTVETMNLDGETNLKIKQAVLSRDEYVDLIGNGSMQLEVDTPSANMYSFMGALKLGGSDVARGITMANVVLRGTSIQGTSEVVVAVALCGHETRVMMNAKAAHMKLSIVDRWASKFVYCIFGVQLVLCLALSAMTVMWMFTRGRRHKYLMLDDHAHGSGIKHFFVSWATWVLQTNCLVPVSLMITMTALKYFQGCFIRDDRRLRGGPLKKGPEVHCSQVIESLGHITHVFSDKTGTLTRNCMEYRACSVGGVMYGFDPFLPDAPSHRKSSPRPSRPHANMLLPGVNRSGVRIAKHVNFAASTFYNDLAKPECSSRLVKFLLCHATCHTVARAPTELGYNASSPDELALVCAARAIGLEFESLDEGRIEVNVNDEVVAAALASEIGFKGGMSSLHLDLLDVCEFDNERKRMSTVIRLPDGRLMLMVKGADSSMMRHLDPEADVDLLEEHLLKFSEKGLRTLCLACRVLPPDFYQDWHQRYTAAQASMTGERARLVQCMAIEVETGGPLKLLGATAIEDDLQDQVPETLESLCEAGLAVWVLTGDKVETAISVMTSCRLLTRETVNLIVTEHTMEGVRQEMLAAHAQIRTNGLAEFGLTVSGAALEKLLSKTELRREVFSIASKCRTVVACRVSPKQKADVVELVKEFDKKAITLAIGDGANDVSMLVQAHIGIGLLGQEGAQAAQAADFALAEFRLLKRLLFVHGRESFRRNAVVVLYNFYKNQLVIIPQVLWAYASAFSGRFLFHPLLTQLFNVLFAHVPICLYGLFDRACWDLTDLEKDAKGYRSVNSIDFSVARRWFLAAAVQSCYLYLMACTTLSTLRSPSGAETADLYTCGVLCYGWVIFCANITMLQHVSCWFFFTFPTIMFGTSCYMMSVRITGAWGMDGFAGIVYALLKMELVRTITSTLVVLVGHILIGETILRTFLGPSRKPRYRGSATSQTSSTAASFQDVELESQSAEGDQEDPHLLRRSPSAREAAGVPLLNAIDSSDGRSSHLDQIVELMPMSQKPSSSGEGSQSLGRSSVDSTSHEVEDGDGVGNEHGHTSRRASREQMSLHLGMGMSQECALERALGSTSGPSAP